MKSGLGASKRCGMGQKRVPESRIGLGRGTGILGRRQDRVSWAAKGLVAVDGLDSSSGRGSELTGRARLLHPIN